mmetsp:Transcript_25597/g.52086  ORF Transcript_25597/g.52086 Transcript_25597/m.52086 type:complete len:288 (+) Transcript_25597:24-887(+)
MQLPWGGIVLLLVALIAASSSVAHASTHNSDFQFPKHGEGDIILDTNIRDWVLFPIFGIMICFTILREYANKMFTANSKAELDTVQETQAIKKSGLLRTQGNWIPEESFSRRRAFYVDKEKGVFNKEVKKTDPMAMMQDPNMMLMQQKSMFTVMLPQMVMMGLISYFFSGFVMVKIPLPLSLKFKAMTQRGIDLASLDVTFVSSLSWYFLVSYGISGVIQLILGRQTSVSDTQAMEQQMKMQTGGAGGQIDTAKLFQAELEALNMVEHKFIVENAETRLLEKLYVAS